MFFEKYPTLLWTKTQVNEVESKRASQERAKFLNTWLRAHQRWNNNNNINWRSIEREIRDRQEADRMFGVLTPGGPLWLSHWHADQGPYIYSSAVLMLLSDPSLSGNVGPVLWWGSWSNYPHCKGVETVLRFEFQEVIPFAFNKMKYR